MLDERLLSEGLISKLFSLSVVCIEMVLKTCTSFTVISIFLRLIVLQTMSPTKYSVSPTVRVDIPTSLVVVACCWSYYLWNYRYGVQEQCTVSPIFCKTMDTAVKTSVSLVLQHSALEHRIDGPMLSKTNDFLVWRRPLEYETYLRPTINTKPRTIDTISRTIVRGRIMTHPKLSWKVRYSFTWKNLN